MLGIKQDSTVDEHSPKTFVGVRFVLFGFDPIDAQKVRSKLVNGGGVGVGQYSPICTHVIVDKLIYDDPICVAARADGKILVTGLWVDHSFDIGMPVDSTSVMYRPLRDLNGIPGAKSLIVCLTGYQRQDRDDIMTMVDLMGANFSKPLVANKVTHLVCYKFEGEKYELAKKMKTIELVNHRWLEDCLRAWEILPEGNYNTSGYELEMMEAEAKDSEEEEAAQDIPKMQYDVSPHNLHISTERAHPSPQSKESMSRNLQAASASRGSPSAWNNNDTVLFTAKEIAPVQASNLQDNYKKHLEELGSPDTRTARGVTCHESSEKTLKTYNRTPTSDKVGNDLSSSLASAMRSHSDVAKLSTISYMRKTPRRNTLPVFSGEMASHLSSFSKVNEDKFSDKDDFHISSFRLEQAEDGTDSGFVKTPSAETEIRHEEGKSDNVPEKRKLDVSHGSSKSQKTSHDSEACIPVSPLVSNRTGGSEPLVLRNGMLDENAAPNPLQSSSAAKCSHVNRKSLPKPIVNAVISESRQTNFEASQTSFITLKKISSANEPGTSDAVNKADNAVSDVGKPQEELQDAEVPSSKSKSSGVEKSNIPSLNLSRGEDAHSLSKPLRKKLISKKSLGSRPKLSPSNAKNKKCSIYVNKAALQSDAVISSVSGRETVDREVLVNCEDRTPTADVDKATVVETNNVAKSGNEVESKAGYMDDETEAPEDREEQEHEFETGVGKEKSMEADQSNKMNMEMKDKSDHVQTTAVKNDFNILSICDPMKALDKNENGAELEKAVCVWKNKPNLSTSKEDSVKEKITKRKKCSLGRTLRKSVHSITGKRKSMDCGNAEQSQNEKNIKKTENKEENSIPHSTGNSKKTVPANKSENSMEVEKENRPVDTEDQSVSRNTQRTGKVASKLNRFPMKIDPKSGVSDPDSVPATRVPKVKIEPAWFILSGHKLQRKEFQQVIRRLKGRICRDSHHWSYQATHFIVPDPIRRTEKFFAAAASGSWILKTDYLTASNQAGRFLAEEPYEWHKKGLSEDGAINLEAPRKWRLLRERTGHGAFYGMCIVVYGECIAPPLDTLKRVIKAGDGTILATSPPYTRFLESGVDFAVVSPGMPRVDVWIQEFLRHEIPCVVADYLVEYVCKPGYSLERHVQYNTHAWADRSFSNILSRAEEVIEEPTTPEDCVNNDLPCQLCGSRDRGEVMLICGDEGGSTGCGVGMHIDCCNPPLENVPEEDWFCPKCSESINNMKRPKGSKKGTSSSKGK